ncbi:MAG: hypothetical protein FJ087_03550 [Deltaproteobacteria bacterium]|nr:hypothetical protein [Deltaproteobacteria bacterium]
MTKALRVPVVLVTAIVAASAAGCVKTSGRNPLKDQVRKEQVNLPSRPNLAVRPAAEKYQDGALSVEGFLRQARDLVGREVTLRGYIQAVETCPAEQERCEIVPHMALVDDLSAARRKVFVVADPPDLFFKDMPAKSQQTLKGAVAMWSPDGRLINLDGMLVVKLAVPAPAAAPGVGATTAASK